MRSSFSGLLALSGQGLGRFGRKFEEAGTSRLQSILQAG